MSPQRNETFESGRKRAAGLLAKATADELNTAWAKIEPKPEIELLRGPETGLVMVRGRIGGGGDPFNLGETTVSRASIRLACGTVGHAQALGTDRSKARLAAIFDALWQKAETTEQVEHDLLTVVVNRISAEDERTRQQTAATRVDFFTMVRGED